jgi:uncharacterized linocin/CFP29 family protein
MKAVIDSFEKLGFADMKAVIQGTNKADIKKVMSFVGGPKKRIDGGEKPKDVFERKLVFDERVVLQELVPFLKQVFKKMARSGNY